jgi:hypothetical protein
MAATRTQAKPEQATGHDTGDLEQTVTALASILARLIVRQATGQGAATFQQIATHELHVATAEDADTLVAWLTTHR